MDSDGIPPGNSISYEVDDMIALDFENDNNWDHLLDDGHEHVEGVSVPEVGMKFDNEEEMYNFYKKYAYEVGFPIRKRNSQKNYEGVVKYVVYACSQEGRKSRPTSSSLKPQSTIQTGCKAKITASADACGVWRINTVNLIHNHKTSPSKSRLYRWNRELSSHIKRRLEVNDIAGIPLHKSYNSAVVEAGGYENMTFVEKDCRNYVEQVRRFRLGEGDAAAIQAYSSNMQSRCSGFYFSIDLDEELRLKNIFWADKRSREAYKEFDDVVTFDTTYLTNKYDMPFAPFVGVNHHGQSILFGCGLVSNENTETFVWLFKTCPVFEDGWRTMVDRYSLHDNAWLLGLFENRSRWVPCFLKSSFWTGMSTTQRSESMNAFFDGYVHAKTSLKQFVEQYERALRNKVEKEFQADFKSDSQMVLCSTKFELEKQFQRVYAIEKFHEVQEEFIGKVYCDLISSSEGVSGTTYEVLEDVIVDEWVKKQMFFVTFDRQRCEIQCSCRLFEFRGIVCRHVVAVLIRNNVTSLPETYILRRWRRDVSRSHTKVAVTYDGLSGTPEQLRYDKMCQSFASLADMATGNDEQTDYVLQWIESKKLSMQMARSICESNDVTQPRFQIVSDGGASLPNTTLCIHDPKCLKRKGAPRKLRIKSPLESASSKVKSKSSSGRGRGRGRKVGPSTLGKVANDAGACTPIGQPER